MKKVITYQSPRGRTINLTPAQVERLRSAGAWPRDERGQEYCTVSHGLHLGEPVAEEYLNTITKAERGE